MTAIGDMASIVYGAPPKSWLYLTGQQWSVYDQGWTGVFRRGDGHAIEAAEIGFYFEEGGCWAMAAALHTVFSERGNQVEMRYQAKDFVHAWAVVDGIAIDHQGVMLNDREGFCCSAVLLFCSWQLYAPHISQGGRCLPPRPVELRIFNRGNALSNNASTGRSLLTPTAVCR